MTILRHSLWLLLTLISLQTGFTQAAEPAAVANPIYLEADPGILEQYMETITPADLKEHLYILASDEYEGRETGELGQKLAAEYIARHFFEHGFEGPVKDNFNPYFQPVALQTVKVGNVQLSSPNHELVLDEEFMPLGRFDADLSGVELVFGGYGLDTEKYSDLEDLDVEGKGVVIIDGLPKDKKGKEIVEEAPRISDRGANLFRKGAKVVIITFPSQEEYRSKSGFLSRYSRASLSLQETESTVRRSPNTAYFVAPDAVAQLFGIEPAEYYETIEKAGRKKQSPAGAFNTQVNVSSEVKEQPVSSENVLGYMEGTDLKDELVVITSHYDHVGVLGGQIHNGADDDGSGTVGVLEIAQAFAKAAEAGHRPRRSILFMTVTGEEKGLLGSQYYADYDPIFPLENTVVNFNIDMIGRGDDEHADQPQFVYIIGSSMLSTDLHNIHEKVASAYVDDLMLDYKYNTKDDPQRFYYRSDHYNFAKNNIPVIFYFNGTHEDYHRPGDTPDKIDYETLALRARLIFATAWEVANREERPVVDKAE